MSSNTSTRDPRLRSRANSALQESPTPTFPSQTTPTSQHPVVPTLHSDPLYNPYSLQGHSAKRSRDEEQREDMRNKRQDQSQNKPSTFTSRDGTSTSHRTQTYPQDQPQGSWVSKVSQHYNDSSMNSRGSQVHPQHDRTSKSSNEIPQARNSHSGHQTSTHITATSEKGKAPSSRYKNPFTRLSEPTRSSAESSTSIAPLSPTLVTGTTGIRNAATPAVPTSPIAPNPPRTPAARITQPIHVEERDPYNNYSHDDHRSRISHNRRDDYERRGSFDTKENYDIKESHDGRSSHHRMESRDRRPNDDRKESRDTRESRDRGENRDRRGRSKSRRRSRSRERGRSVPRPRSSDRGRSVGRSRSKSERRGRSRSTRRIITMGEISNKRRRSLSRHTHYGSDLDISMSDLESDDDSDYSVDSRPRSHKSSGHRRKSQYTFISSDDESQLSMSQSDTPLAMRSKLNSRLSDPLAKSHSDRFDKSMQMILKMNSLMDKCTIQMELLNSTFRKMESINKRFNIEMWEMRKEMKSQGVASSGGFGSQSVPSSPLLLEHTKTFQSSSTSRSRNNSIQTEGFPPSSVNRSETTRPLNPIPPPPSLQPVPVRKKSKDDEVVEGMVTIRVPTNLVRDIPHTTPTWRSTGFRRVFEVSSFQIPVASLPTMSVFSLRNKKVIEKASMGKTPRPMKFNPFSHQTRFEGIAAICTNDGSIQFWNINSRELVLSLSAKETRIFPYTEVLTWVSEDTIVALSHLKYGAEWPEAPDNLNLPIISDQNIPTLPETQTNLITLYFTPEGKLTYRVVNITSMPHDKPISAVAAVMREDHSMSYVTGGYDRGLYHWQFHAPSGENQNIYEPEGLKLIHRLHSNAITSLSYSHISKTLFSGGRDSRFISFSLEHQRIIKEVKLGYILHINQNPVDPRINAVTLQSLTNQYMIMDERSPAQAVLKLGYTPDHKTSKVTYPSWHPEGGLFCSGTNLNGTVNVWDIRWNGIKHSYYRRPGAGVVTGEVQFDHVITGNDASRHPIFRKRQPIEGYYRETVGGPSQILDLGGKKILHAGFHPSKNVMIAQNADSSLSFIDYALRSDPIV